MRVIAAFLINTAINFVIGLFVAKFLGPDQFGRFALALAIGMVLQTLTLEWIRLSTVRFYSDKSRTQQPELRATLDAAFGIISIIVTAAFIAYLLSGVDVSLSPSLIGLAVAAAIANGLFDYHTAVVRARFLDRLYGQLIITKNIMALVLTVGGAFISGSALMALTGACLSMAGSVLIAHKALSDSMSPLRIAQRSLAGQFARYSLPIVAANVLYLMIPLVNRSLVTSFFGFAETGQFSLAYDIGTRLIAAIGSALDVLLFQLAVRAETEHGSARAKEQVAQNMAVVFAILAPAAAGLWLVLPSVEHLIVPEQFRGPFGVYLTLMLPGLFCFGLMNFAINAVFQIEKKTLPLIAAAVAACIANPIFVWLLPRGGDASSLAIAQAAAFAVALAVLALFATLSGARWPRARDVGLTIAGVALMTLALLPLRAMPPGVITLLAQCLGGGLIFGTVVAVFDIAGLRRIGLETLQKLRRRGV
jgi:O-antigen/teichoic acid export membrane protein